MCINFNRVGIVSGRISLLYCYCIWLLSQSIFVYLLIAHILRLSLSIRVKFIGTVLIQPLSPCIFLSIWAVLRQPLGVWVYIYVNMTILILPLGTCIEIGTGLMSFIISGTVMPLCVYNETVTGRMSCISREWINIATGHHWAYRFAFIGTVLILPLGIKCVYIDFKLYRDSYWT